MKYSTGVETFLTINEISLPQFFVINQGPSHDPTKTLTLRNRFAATTRGRFNKLKTETRQYLNEQPLLDSDKTGFLLASYFLPWFERKAKDVIIGDAEWLKPYLRQAILAGISRSDSYLAASGRPTSLSTDQLPEEPPDLEKYHKEVVAALVAILAVMTLQARESLIKAIQEGQDPIAAVLDRIEKIGRTRGDVLARTETVRIYNDAALSRMELLGVLFVTAQLEYEFTTAGDDRVCPICAALDGEIYTIAEARGVIPVHPNCRCSWVPVWL